MKENIYSRNAVYETLKAKRRQPARLLIAQNAQFDVNYMNEMYRRVGKPAPNDIGVDTVKIFRKFLTPALKKFQSDELLEYNPYSVERVSINGQKIPAKKLSAAAKKSGKLGQRARLAKTLKGMKWVLLAQLRLT